MQNYTFQNLICDTIVKCINNFNVADGQGGANLNDTTIFVS